MGKKEKRLNPVRHGLKELASAVDMSVADTKEIFNDFVTFISDMGVGDKMSVPGLGIFEKVVKLPRKARNPHTGETIMTKKKVTLKFKLANPLRDL